MNVIFKCYSYKGYSYIAPSIIFSSNVLTNHIDNETISNGHAPNGSYNYCLNSWLKVFKNFFYLFKNLIDTLNSNTT